MAKKGLTSKQLSTLHWKLRRKGLSYKKALQEAGKAKAASKRYGYGKAAKWKKKKYYDSDGDGKVDKYDCRPFDRKRQDGFSMKDPKARFNVEEINENKYNRKVVSKDIGSIISAKKLLEFRNRDHSNIAKRENTYYEGDGVTSPSKGSYYDPHYEIKFKSEER